MWIAKTVVITRSKILAENQNLYIKEANLNPQNKNSRTKFKNLINVKKR